MALVHVGLRLDEEWLKRADEVAKKLSTEWMVVNRTDAIRAAIVRGFESIEKEYEAKQNDGRPKF
jgi:hypothetical protein